LHVVRVIGRFGIDVLPLAGYVPRCLARDGVRRFHEIAEENCFRVESRVAHGGGNQGKFALTGSP